jgi:hypothetical protein
MSSRFTRGSSRALPPRRTAPRASRARLVAVVGNAGMGKSRLLWEFFKYLDGVEQECWWYQGRCLSYGEGVA